ncbi:hypothetical protein [Sphaerisporangium perillae]|uniref:hypothetical protein n=1 Tax=Sphaerisporangium perillae TaxID=2935860 RepID=UPI00200E835E|nr:hypothetical protein [Sphaerisporangium perillae]
MSAERAVTIMLEVFEGQINFVDTSNGYGGGDSERRICGAERGLAGMTRLRSEPGRRPVRHMAI